MELNGIEPSDGNLRLRPEDPQGETLVRPEVARVAGRQRQSVFRGRRRHDGIPGAHAGRQPVFLDVHEGTMADVLVQGEDRKGKIPEVSLDFQAFRPTLEKRKCLFCSGAAVSSNLWIAADKLAGLRPNHYFLLQTRTYLFCRNVKIEIRLQPKPKLRRCAEITGKTESCLSRYTTLPQDNFIDPPWRHTNVERQAVLAQRHRF